MLRSPDLTRRRCRFCRLRRSATAAACRLAACRSSASGFAASCSFEAARTIVGTRARSQGARVQPVTGWHRTRGSQVCLDQAARRRQVDRRLDRVAGRRTGARDAFLAVPRGTGTPRADLAWGVRRSLARTASTSWFLAAIAARSGWVRRTQPIEICGRAQISGHASVTVQFATRVALSGPAFRDGLIAARSG